MRIDRAITLAGVAPLRATWKTLSGGSGDGDRTLPILMYHSISDSPESDAAPYYRVCTSPARFAEQMACLAENGWRGVTLREGLASLAGSSPASPLNLQLPPPTRDSRESRAPLPSDLPPLNLQLPTSTRGSREPRLVAITFDDGFRDFQTAAVPILQQHGFAATMYLATGYIGDQRREFKNRECLTWSEVRELDQAGMEFGSHTVNHPTLVERPWSEIRSELAASKAEIERHLGKAAGSFGYPYAFPQADAAFVRQFRALLQELGYVSCVTTMIGRADSTTDPLQLPRLPVNSADDRALLKAKLKGAYDWMALPQILRKRSKGRSAQPTQA